MRVWYDEASDITPKHFDYIMRSMPMRVYVVTANDFPDRVYHSEEAAKAYIAAKLKLQELERENRNNPIWVYHKVWEMEVLY